MVLMPCQPLTEVSCDFKVTALSSELSDERFRGDAVSQALDMERAERLRLCRENKELQVHHGRCARGDAHACVHPDTDSDTYSQFHVRAFARDRIFTYSPLMCQKIQNTHSGCHLIISHIFFFKLL